MFTPQGSSEDRLRRVERQLEDLLRAGQGGQRRAAPLLARSASHLVVLDEALAYGGSAACSIWFDDGRGGWRDSGKQLPAEAYDWVLEPGMTLAAGSRAVAELFPHDSNWYIVRALAPCQQFKAGSTTTSALTESGAFVNDLPLVTVVDDEGGLAELDASGNVVCKISGGLKARFVVTLAGDAEAGAAARLEKSTDNGSAWNAVAWSTVRGSVPSGSNPYVSLSQPAATVAVASGDLLRVAVDHLTSGAALSYVASECYLLLEPCGVAVGYDLATELTGYWTPTLIAIPTGGGPPVILEIPTGRTPSTAYAPFAGGYPELIDLGGIAYTPGDQESYAWALDGSITRVFYAGRPHDTDADFTVEVRFNLQSHGADSTEVPLYFAHQQGSGALQDVYITLSKNPANSGSDIGASVGRTLTSATVGFLTDEIATGTWYTVFLRWDASTLTATLDVVGGGTGAATGFGDQRIITTPVLEVGGSPDWVLSDKFLEVEIERVRHWQRRLADWELA